MILVISGASMTANVWKQERFVAQVNSVTDSVKLWSNIEGSEASPIAVYSPASGKVLIDLSDYVRTYASTLTNLYIKNGSATATNITVSFKGLINPASVVIPSTEVRSEFEAYIMPPSMILEPVGTSTIVLETYAAGTYQYATGRLKALPSESVANLAPQMTLPAGTTAFELWHLTDTKKASVQLQPLMCGHGYAMVEWVSFTGVTRRHTFEVVKCKTEAAGAYSLLPVDNEFVEIKGRQDGFVLRIDNLDAYDMWYYADLLASSRVQVSMDGSIYARVQITSKNVTLPDGEAGEKGKLEINVNWKRYDAVAL